MKSCLYECRVLHARFAPLPHRFLYRIFFFAIDLDEVETLPGRLALFSTGSRNIYSFREGDFLPIQGRLHPGGEEIIPGSPSVDGRTALSLKQRVTTFVARHGVDLTGGRVVLVTLPRVFGYLFNPVSFYFCYDRDGVPAAAVAEVTNTFREVKPYFLGPDALCAISANAPAPAGGEGIFHLRVPKHFYVSPYSDVDVAFDFTLHLPGPRFSVQIDDYVGSERTLTSTVSGDRRELTSARLAWFTVKYPFITLSIITAIHWQALRLWWKRVPWFAKAARASDQRDLYRPHPTLHSRDAT